MNAAIRTKDIVRQTGVGREALRFYERQGLLPKPRRSDSGYRAYTPGTVSRIQFIKRAQAAGFSLREIRQMLSMKVGPATTCGNMEKIARAKVSDIDEKIRSLRRMRKVLTSFADACKSGRSRQCNFIIQGLTGDCCR